MAVGGNARGRGEEGWEGEGGHVDATTADPTWHAVAAHSRAPSSGMMGIQAANGSRRVAAAGAALLLVCGACAVVSMAGSRGGGGGASVLEASGGRMFDLPSSKVMSMERRELDGRVGASSQGVATSSLYIPDYWKAYDSSPEDNMADVVKQLKKLGDEMKCMSDCTRKRFHLDGSSWDDETINASDPVVVVISRGPPAGANVTRNISSSDGKELLNCVEKCTGETDVNATRDAGESVSVAAELQILQSGLASATSQLQKQIEGLSHAKARATERLVDSDSSSSLLVTGDRVDGRRTVPGLLTDCAPGDLESDCSPPQEDGAYSREAGKFLDAQGAQGGASSMKRIQRVIDAQYAARQKYTDDCLSDWRKCSGRVVSVPGSGDRQGEGSLGGGGHVDLPSGDAADPSGLVSPSYYH